MNGNAGFPKDGLNAFSLLEKAIARGDQAAGNVLIAYDAQNPDAKSHQKFLQLIDSQKSPITSVSTRNPADHSLRVRVTCMVHSYFQRMRTLRKRFPR